jgi:hypothetical protein
LLLIVIAIAAGVGFIIMKGKKKKGTKPKKKQ